jgi:CheY-like chemotaxis protein
MSVVALFSASHCQADEVAAQVAERLGSQVLTDEKLFAAASAGSSFSPDKLERAMHGPRSFFHRWTRERERAVAMLRVGLAELMAEDGLLYHGFATLLLPRSLTHVLRVCVVARSEHRVQSAVSALGVSEKEARDLLQQEDRTRQEFAELVLRDSPWDKDRYDIFLPMDTSTVAEAVEVICDNAAKPPLQVSDASRQAVIDYQLAAQVNLALTERGHDVFVSAESGVATITIDHYVLRLEHLEKELSKIAGDVPGVKSVHTRVGPHFNRPNIYPKIDMPRKILLVDDEKEFVRTLSERLETRDLDAALAYDGEQALALIETDAPDVMVLDLKMPGIDGLEVLRRVKREHPNTQVIILTGHGSQTEENLARELGAFAYLQKPADIDVLAKTMKAAYEKAQATKEKEGESDAVKHDEPAGS